MGNNLSITTIDEKVHTVMALSLPASAIKEMIYRDLCQQLQPSKMSLEINGIKVDDRKDSLLEYFQLKQQRPNTLPVSSIGSGLLGRPALAVLPVLRIVQKKASLDAIKGLRVDMEYECPVSCEKGAAIMPCGHKAGKQYMLGLLRKTIGCNQIQVRCPEKNQYNYICKRVWDIDICKKVAVLTLSEQTQISEGLSINWMKNNCKQCPKCHNQIMKVGIDHNRVKCNYCKYGDFCFFCLAKWRTFDNIFCGNQNCQIYMNTLRNAPLSRQFRLKKDNKPIVVETPQYRACPQCQIILQNTTGCKHTTCNKCKKQFCWVCLKPKEQYKWKCGQYYDHCGVVAARQYS